MTTPRRRWFRFAFSLRTLFIVVTIFGVWLGWQLKIVRERKAMIQIIRQSTGGRANVLGAEPIPPQFQFDRNAYPSQYVRIPAIRQLLGDEPYDRLNLPIRSEKKWIEQVEIAFPEAELFLPLEGDNNYAFRDSLYAPSSEREPNRGNIFKTGLIEK